MLVLNLRLGVKKTGCSGFAYVIDYADEVADGDYVFVRRAAGFAAVAVERIAADGDRLVVRGPLTVDDEIAVSGVAAIKGAWMGIGGGE